MIFFSCHLVTLANLQAAKAYEAHVAKNGTPPSHEKAKEILYIVLS